MHGRRLLPWTIVASLALHGVAYASLGEPRGAAPQAPRKTQLRFEVKAREVAKPPEPPPPEPPKPKPAAPKPAAKPESPPAAPPPEVPAPPPEPASDGVTLAGSGDGPGFTLPLGTGGDLTPTRVPTVPAANVPAPVAPPPSPRAAPPVVAVADLSSRPSPPALGAALERNYPAEARRSGSSGSAKVRARIDPDGVVRQVTLLQESAPGFGSACRRTLSGSRWGAPKDKAGHSVATEIRYTCRFVVQP